jgi:hypothetical protein
MRRFGAVLHVGKGRPAVGGALVAAAHVFERGGIGGGLLGCGLLAVEERRYLHDGSPEG